MSLCESHAVCLSHNIYKNEDVANVLCRLLQCPGPFTVGTGRFNLEFDISSETECQYTFEALLCLLAGLPNTEKATYAYNSLRKKCNEGYLKKKMLYFALTARSESDLLTSMLHEDRIFFRKEDNFWDALQGSHSNLLMELFLLTVKEECHWLPILLEKLSSLLNNENYNPVVYLLSSPILTHFWPVLFLYALEKKLPLSALKLAVENCTQIEDCEPSVKQLAKKLQWYLTILHWIDENGVSFHTCPELYSQHFSTLSLLWHSCNISDLPYFKVHNFLAGHASSWEVAVYDAFSACSLAFECVLTHLHSQNTKTKKFTNSENFEKLRVILCQLKPVSVRLKVLENIFSLLFLQYEDFQDDAHSDSDEEERETNQSPQCDDGQTTNVSFDVMSSSLTSIVNAVEPYLKKGSKFMLPSCISPEPGEDYEWRQSNINKHGFVCDRILLRDILKLLDACLTSSADFDDESGFEECDKPLEYILVHTDKSEVESRFKSLQSKVSNALWKLETLLELSVAEQLNEEDVVGEKQFLPDWIFYNCIDDDSASDDEAPLIKNPSYANPKRPDVEKSSESGSQSTATFPGPSGKWNHKSRRKSTTRFSMKGMKDNIIKKMLSSEYSFVAHCLSHGNFEAAKRVIQALDLSGSEIAAEVYFAEAYKSFQEKIQSCVEDSDRCFESPQLHSEKSTLKAIRRAASAGVQASSVIKEFEALLSNKVLPCISVVNHIPKDYLQLFGSTPSDQPIVCAAVDIALMLSTNAQQATNFLNIASKYSSQLLNLQVSSALRTQLMGYLPLVQSFLQVTVIDCSSPAKLFHRWDVLNFTSRVFRETLFFWESLKTFLKELQTSRNYVAVFPKFLQLTSSCPSLKGVDVRQEHQYFQDFKSYLKLLKACKDRSTVSSFDGPLVKEHFLLLEKNPKTLLANMVLDEGMLPESLESLASQLGCNIPHILSLEFSSKLASVPPSKPYTKVSSLNSLKYIHVLNSETVCGPCRHPLMVAEALLKSTLEELSCQLSRIKELDNFMKGVIPIDFISMKQISPILAATWELRYVDLKLLQPGAETVAFFCNLSNLLLIHCLIYLSETKQSDFYDTYIKFLVGGNSSQQLIAMNSFAYEVGSAGTLTLWNVRRLAMGVELVLPAGTKALHEYAYATDSYDPLALFVISSGTKYSPKIQVLRPENLEEQLQQSVREYVQYSVQMGMGEVLVPSLIQHYIKKTGQNIRIFLVDHLGDSIRDEIDALPESLLVSQLPDDISPQIILNYHINSLNEAKIGDETQTSWKSNANLCESILQYIKDHSPLVAFILPEILKEYPVSESDSGSDEEVQEATEMIGTTLNISSLLLKPYPSLNNLCQRPDVSTVSQIFKHNVLLCCLHSFVPQELLWEKLNTLACENNWSVVVDLLLALPHIHLQSDPTLSLMLDLALLELTLNSPDLEKPWLFCEKINSLFFRAKCVINASIHWPGDICSAQLQKILQMSNLKSYPIQFKRVQSLLHSITVYEKIVHLSNGTPWKSWQEVQSTSQTEPTAVLNKILSHQDAEICMLWIDLHNILTMHPHLIDSKVVVLLLNDAQDNMKAAERVLKSMPINKALKICFEALNSLSTISAFKFFVKFCNSHCSGILTAENNEILKTISVGIQMLEVLPGSIQIECLELVQNPHLIIEQLIMNMQLEAAERMLNLVGHQFKKLGPKSPLAETAVDSMIRQYAEKALEFRICQESTSSQISENSVLLASLSSHSESKDLPMPQAVPSKAEWVPNELASVCMNCQISTFTMFNRRHHCRRCGGVVCAQCSSHRVLVEGYGSLKVRVCNSCHQKMNGIAQTDTVPNSEQVTLPDSDLSLMFVWRLSNSSTYNKTIREEFAYEHAPSVSLCLSILKLHSESAACPNFLVDSCETILRYLQSKGRSPNPEVDYGFVIEMCRSLVLAAKVKCAQWGYVSDEPNCDQRLSKIDLFGLLVSNGCTALIPTETSNHGLRRLQTQLLESELWELALEVSTKSGMERIGVWTAWGKGCLKAGRWEEAREKFTHCFPSSSRTNRSAPDSPLLLDILQILESTPHSMDQEVLRKAESLRTASNRLAHAPALAVLHSLASLKNISQGKFNQTRGASGSLEPLVYSECCYYLKEYGSHSSYLCFLVRHNDLKAAVQHTLSNSVDPQMFFESVYMPCLRRGQITPLHSAMTSVDSSLVIWKSYLHGICAALERRKLFHTLYEVQQWSKDHVRAAMTCIRFYHLNAKTYSQLSANINHLMRAQSHLEGAIAEASACCKAKQSDNSDSQSDGSSSEGTESMWLQLSTKELDHHMSTLERQKELTKFLSAYEATGRDLFEAASWFPHAFAEPLAHGLPTLFGSPADRKLLSGLCLFCGKNVEEGYGIVFRIIEGFNISAHEIYEAVAVALFNSGRAIEIPQLLNCIRSSGVSSSSQMCDSVLMTCVNEMSSQPNASHLDLLVRNISDRSLKIKAFIACGQLKSAYLLAVKSERLDDIESILQEAKKLGQTAIEKICLKRLGRL